jgi:hypothetical protein
MEKEKNESGTGKAEISGKAHRTRGSKVFRDGPPYPGDKPFTDPETEEETPEMLKKFLNLERMNNKKLRKKMEELEKDIDKLSKELNDCKESYHEATNKYNIAKGEGELLRKTIDDLSKEIELLKAPQSHTASDFGFEYHPTLEAGEIEFINTGPMNSILTSIKELESMGFYCTFDLEYDTPAGHAGQKREK